MDAPPLIAPRGGVPKAGAPGCRVGTEQVRTSVAPRAFLLSSSGRRGTGQKRPVSGRSRAAKGRPPPPAFLSPATTTSPPSRRQSRRQMGQRNSTSPASHFTCLSLSLSLSLSLHLSFFEKRTWPRNSTKSDGRARNETETETATRRSSLRDQKLSLKAHQLSSDSRCFDPHQTKTKNGGYY